MKDVMLSPLKIIENEKGNIYRALRVDEEAYEGFGEAYFSTINFNQIKGWKKHTNMTMNLIVPVGEIQLVLYDDRYNRNHFSSINLGQNNYQRLTVPPQVWMAFKGLGSELNLLLNISNILHDPSESENMDLDKLAYSWG